MKRTLLALGLLLGLATTASAQCVAVGGVNSVPQTGVTCPSEPSVATYGAMGYGIIPVSSATDVACITGSATKVVRLQSVQVSGTAGTLVSLPVLLNKHTVANTGGTAAVTTALPVPMKLDSRSPTATATTTAYTANPTIDATAAQMDVITTTLTTTGTTVSSTKAFFDYKSRPYMEAPTLRGVAQQYCVNLGAVSVSSGLLAVSFLWTEAAQ